MANHYNIFYIFVLYYNTTMDELKKIFELISLILLSLLSLPFIILTYLLIFILQFIESIWKDHQGKDNIR